MVELPCLEESGKLDLSSRKTSIQTLPKEFATESANTQNKYHLDGNRWKFTPISNSGE